MLREHLIQISFAASLYLVAVIFLISFFYGVVIAYFSCAARKNRNYFTSVSRKTNPPNLWDGRCVECRIEKCDFDISK